MLLSSWLRVIARVNPIHTMNTEQCQSLDQADQLVRCTMHCTSSAPRESIRLLPGPSFWPRVVFFTIKMHCIL